MALKDLVAKKSEVNEAAIEGIIKNFIHFDVEAKEIILTPIATALPNRKKILLYFVALQGWPYVTNEDVSSSVSPGELEAVLGIPGGTLRPTLMDLKNRGYLIAKEGRYEIRLANLSAIQDVFEEREEQAVRISRAAKPAKASLTKVEHASVGRRKSSPSKGRSGGAGASFDSWIAEGFFREPKTLSDVQVRFHKEGIILPQTSIPGYLLGRVRQKALSRDRQSVNGKTVWVYQSTK